MTEGEKGVFGSCLSACVKDCPHRFLDLLGTKKGSLSSLFQLYQSKISDVPVLRFHCNESLDPSNLFLPCFRELR
jgi:hypothetical protein